MLKDNLQPFNQKGQTNEMCHPFSRSTLPPDFTRIFSSPRLRAIETRVRGTFTECYLEFVCVHFCAHVCVR